jgi:Region in Clathrin and VPS
VDVIPDEDFGAAAKVGNQAENAWGGGGRGEGVGEDAAVEKAGEAGAGAAAAADWGTCMSLLFEADERGAASDHGERAQTLYVAWPAAAKVVVIGPHIDPPRNDPKDPDELHPAPPPRKVETVFNVAVGDVPALGGGRGHVNALLGIAPFGDHIALLAGTTDHRVVLARVPRGASSGASGEPASALPAARGETEDGEATIPAAAQDVSEKNAVAPASDMLMLSLPHDNLRAGSLHSIPGGEPLVLVVVEMQDSVGEEADDVVGANAAEGVESCASAPPDAVGTELVASPRRESFANDEDVMTPVEDGCVLFARVLSTAERVKWLLENGMFAEALTAAEFAPRGSLRRADVSIADVGDQFLDHIRSSGDYKRLADVLPRVIVSTSPSVAMRGHESVMEIRRARWAQWIEMFRGEGKIELVARVIPCFEPRMPSELYTGILSDLALSNPVTMLNVLQTWPADVYDVEAVTRAVEEQSAAWNDAEAGGGERNNTFHDAYREALFMLYGLSGRQNETLHLLLVEKSDRVFGYAESHNLYETIANDEVIQGLYMIDKKRATELLLQAPGTLLAMEAVVPILRSIGNREWLCSYLHAVFLQDPERSASDHDLLLELLVAYGPEGALYSFLKISSHFSLDTALKLMGGRSGKGKGVFGRERVFVLATMGDLNSAMNILLVELQDVKGAIEFASEHGDKALWDRLIEHARGNADTLAALLDSPAGGKVNPVRLIPLIASDMEIPHLRDRLHRILVDAALERALREETAAALHFDASRLMKELDETVCGVENSAS